MGCEVFSYVFWHKDCYILCVTTIRKGVECAIRTESRGYKGFTQQKALINT
jgi:hypothetical protein